MTGNFYTYVIRDPRDFEPIYVGKGTGKRMYTHWSSMLNASCSKTNPFLYNKLTNIFKAGYAQPIYEKWLEPTDELLCLWFECFLIESIGRGTLCNLTAGGDGIRNPSDHTREKMRIGSTGKVGFWLGKKRPPNIGIAIALSNKVRPRHCKKHSEETKAMMSATSPMRGKSPANKGKPPSDQARENQRLAFLNGRGPLIGENHAMSKLNNKNVKEIYEYLSEGIPQDQIADLFGVSRRAINGIANRESWKHLSP